MLRTDHIDLYNLHDMQPHESANLSAIESGAVRAIGRFETITCSKNVKSFKGDYLVRFKLVALDLGCWWVGKRSIRLSSKFVSEVLLCLSEIELVDQVIFASAALLELAD